ncbi:MAG: hypothetical protein WD824_22755 [Cyclobacteriaceae bacterium]
MIRLIFIAFLAFSACAPVYVPNVRNSPMFTKAGEFQASLQIGNGVEAQSAYAITEHFAVMTNYLYVDQAGFDDEEDFHRNKFFEMGAGYFSNNDESFFEVFVGYGRGKGSSYDTYEFFGSQSAFAEGKYERYFIQPAFGLNKSEVNVSFAPRFSMVDFYKFSNEIASTSIHEEPKFFLEPAIIGRANFANNRMFVVFQAGVSLGMSGGVYFDRRTFQLAGGLGFRLGGQKKLINRL